MIYFDLLKALKQIKINGTDAADALHMSFKYSLANKSSIYIELFTFSLGCCAKNAKKS